MLKIPSSELNFTFSRSSGPGGQNVNKVETKATLSWNFEHSTSLNEVQKQRLRAQQTFMQKLDKTGRLSISDQSTRSQETNKQNCVARLERIISDAIKVRKKRKKTLVPKRAKEKRIRAKQIRAKHLKARQINSD